MHIEKIFYFVKLKVSTKFLRYLKGFCLIKMKCFILNAIVSIIT